MNQLIKKLPFLSKNSTYDQALEYYHRGNFERAIKVFQKVIANPKKAGVYYNLSLFHIKESYLNLGFAYEHMGMYEEAVKNFASAAQICNYPDIHYQLGLCHCFLEEFEKAEQEFRQALEINPKYTSALFLLGFTYVRLHQLSKAVDCFQGSLKVNPHYPDYHYLLGSVYALQHKYDLAKKQFQQALKINPQYLEAEAKIALIEENQQRKEKGFDNTGLDQKLVDEFYKAFAHIPVTGIFSKTIHVPQGEDIISDIILFYEKAIQVNPNYADLHHKLGIYYAKKGDHFRAKEAFLQARKINPHFIQAIVNLALTYQQMGETDKSIRTFLEAVALRPHYPDLHYYLGTLHAEKNDFSAALKEFEKALALNAHYPECHIALAILHEKQGQKKEALYYWNLYLKNCSNQEWEKEIKCYLRNNFSFPDQESSSGERLN